jgi:hypothetical protein
MMDPMATNSYLYVNIIKTFTLDMWHFGEGTLLH